MLQLHLVALQNRRWKHFRAACVLQTEASEELRDYLTYEEERLEGLHADFELHQRALTRGLAEQGYGPRRQVVDTLLLVIWIFLEFFLN